MPLSAACGVVTLLSVFWNTAHLAQICQRSPRLLRDLRYPLPPEGYPLSLPFNSGLDGGVPAESLHQAFGTLKQTSRDQG